MRKTKIVATIGPSSYEKGVFTELVKAGVNVARLNFSHGDHESHRQRMDMIKEVRQELNIPVAILLDTKGPEIRLREVEEGTVLEKGTEFILTSRELVGNASMASITYTKLYKDVEIGDVILIDDGLVGLKVKEVRGEDIVTNVEYGGPIKTKKGVNAPGIKVKLPAVTEKDKADIIFGIEHDIDFIAASFIRKADDVLEIRKILEENGGNGIQIISKIENQEGYDNLEKIIKVSDGIMVARGDLGVEIPIEEVPVAQKKMISMCNEQGKPVITATQMLDSMIRNPSPTRAEATDVANAIHDGTDAIMLSGETAAGKYPVKAVKTMDRIARRTENSLDYNKLLEQSEEYPYHDNVTYAVSRATVETAHNLNAKAIITPTSSGFTAYKVAMHHPKCIIIAATVSEKVRRKLSLVRGVYAVMSPKATSTDELFDFIENTVIDNGILKEGDLAVFTAGIPVGVAGATNLMKVHVIGNVILKGVGIGSKKYTGTLKIINNLEEAKTKVHPGDVIYADYLDEDFGPHINKAGAIITREAGYTSFGAVAGITLGVPAVVGVKKATTVLREGQEITVDAKLGLVHNSSDI